MAEQTKGSRKAPRPTRKGIAITPHKGGRVARFECRLTEAENQVIMQLVAASGLSKSDWLMSMAQPTLRAGDTATPSQAGKRGIKK